MTSRPARRPNVSRVAIRRGQLPKARNEESHAIPSLAGCVRVAGSIFANVPSRSVVAPVSVRREEELLEVVAGAHDGRVDARAGQRAVDLGRSIRRDLHRDPARPRRPTPGHAQASSGDRGPPRRPATSAGSTRTRTMPSPASSSCMEPSAHQASGGDDPDHVGHLLHLGQQVARDEHRLSDRGQVAEHVPHRDDARPGRGRWTGSSRSSSFGSLSNAPAMPSRCFIPSE